MKINELLDLAPLAMRLRNVRALRDKELALLCSGNDLNARFSMDGLEFREFDAIALHNGLYQAAKVLAAALEKELAAHGIERDEPLTESPKPDA